MGNAQRLLDQHHGDILYVHSWKRWLTWDGCHYRPDETGEVMRRAKQTVAAIYGEAAQQDDPEERKKLAAWAAQSESGHRLREMIELARSDAAAEPAQLDANRWYLTALNGTIDLRTGKLLPHSRRDLSTKLAPVAYVTGATCPTWLKFLDRVQGGDGELIGYLQRALGYSLTGETREQVLFFLYGSGANGKSTFLEVLRTLLGHYAQQADFSSFLERRGEGPRNDIARLKGARLVTASEAGQGHRLAESLIKQVTGGDTITARFLYAESFEFRPQFKLWLAANHKPLIRGTDPAIWRRIRLIPFTVTIPENERDPELLQKLLTEVPGILQWAVQGALEWQRAGLGVPSAVRAATEVYRSEMDTLAAFLEESCEEGFSYRCETRALYRAYAAWCETNGERPDSQRTLSAKLKERGYEPTRTNQARGWLGLRVVTGVTARDGTLGDSCETPAKPAEYLTDASPSVTPVTVGIGQRPDSPSLCSLHGGVQSQRRDGTYRCAICIPDNPHNPYLTGVGRGNGRARRDS